MEDNCQPVPNANDLASAVMLPMHAEMRITRPLICWDRQESGGQFWRLWFASCRQSDKMIQWNGICVPADYTLKLNRREKVEICIDIARELMKFDKWSWHIWSAFVRNCGRVEKRHPEKRDHNMETWEQPKLFNLNIKQHTTQNRAFVF